MRVRHRTPLIFSLSMLDVLCCGLGAVILIMLLNYWDAHRQARALEHARAKVGETTRALGETKAALAAARDEYDQVQRKLSQAGENLEKAEADLARRQREIDQRQKELARLQAEREAIIEKLDQAQRAAARTGAQLTRTEQELAETRKKLGAAETAAARAVLLEKNLHETEDRLKGLTSDLAELKKAAEQAGMRMGALRKEKETVLVEVEALKKLLEQQGRQLEEQKASSSRLRSQLTQAEARFAGVDLAGRRVIFLVDMSGSMGLLDYNTPAPAKWPDVCRTVAHLLRSLPEVEKFQVILFANETHFPLGQPGQWLDFQRDRSPAALEEALLRISPKGDTNLYHAFEAAFRYRPLGLDTIFLVSDGLPNLGPGLPAPAPKDEAAQATHLGKYVRDTIQQRWNTGPTPVRIHAVGFYYDSSNLGAFLWALTRENGGSFVGMSKP